MSKPAFDWTKPQRQSPAALLVLLYKALISLLKFLWPLLLLMIIRKKSGDNKMDSYEIIALVVSILSLARSAFEYFNFRFSVVGNELVIKKGFLTKRTITLPLEKIQAVHADQTWLHSLLNVSRLSFDSAGSEKIEAKIEALDKFRSSALKEFILGQRTQIQADETAIQPAAPEEVLIRLSGRDLFKLSISANHLEAFLLLVAFIASSLQSVGISDKEYGGLLKRLNEIIPLEGYQLFLFLAVAALVIGVGISVIKILLIYSDFSIGKSDKGFRIRSGLINKKEKFVPFRKIQFVSWKANWIRNKIGMYLLQLHATGSRQVENKMQVKVPVTRASFIPPLLENYHPLLEVGQISPVRVHKIYIWRRVFVFGMIPALIAGAVLYFYFKEKAFFILGWIFITWVTSMLFQRKFRLWPGVDALQVEKGIFGTHELVLKWDKIQSVHVEQSLYQQKHNLATVALHTAGGNVSLPYLAIRQAIQIRDYALYKIESSTIP